MLYKAVLQQALSVTCLCLAIPDEQHIAIGACQLPDTLKVPSRYADGQVQAVQHLA